MLNVLLVIHLFIAIALVAVVLLQRSEGGALGIGGGGGMGGFLTGRSAANLLTRTTTILAALFIVTSLALTKLSAAPERGVTIPVDVPAAGEPLPREPAPTNLPAPPLAR